MLVVIDTDGIRQEHVVFAAVGDGGLASRINWRIMEGKSNWIVHGNVSWSHDNGLRYAGVFVVDITDSELNSGLSRPHVVVVRDGSISCLTRMEAHHAEILDSYIQHKKNEKVRVQTKARHEKDKFESRRLMKIRDEQERRETIARRERVAARKDSGIGHYIPYMYQRTCGNGSTFGDYAYHGPDIDDKSWRRDYLWDGDWMDIQFHKRPHGRYASLRFE